MGSIFCSLYLRDTAKIGLPSQKLKLSFVQVLITHCDDMLNAQWLETFTVLCETAHFTGAANLLGMTQPGVSQHLQKLEQQVGQTLISRERKSFSLTPAGEAVLAIGQARRLEERALLEAIHSDAPDTGGVAIACSGSFAMLLYPQLLPLMLDAPRLTVRLEAAPRDNIVSGILERRFDLGVIDHKPEHPRLEAIRLGEEELCLILPVGSAPTPIRFEDLDARGFVAHPDGLAYADELFTLNFPNEFRGADRLHIRAFINQISQIPAPVAHGVGYTLLPRSGVDAFHHRKKLKIVKLPKARRHELWLTFLRGRQMPARLARVTGIIKEVAERLAPSEPEN
ncbi:LysR family transcriptional regulator [Hoeflea sp.]|uniref:LysR family transcriptional regulator n=1 Tax=Hoeflea sp. TaxID=1940281 RepID=UPI003A8F367F